MNNSKTHPACLNCGATFAESEISRKRRFAQCGHCDTLHNVSSFFPQRREGVLRIKQLPDKVYFGEDLRGATIQVNPRVELTKSWFAMPLVGLTLFHIFFLAVMFLSDAWSSSGMVAVLVVVASVVWPGWYAASLKTLNVTRIRIDRFAITVRLEPFPPSRSRKFSVNSVHCAVAVKAGNDAEYPYRAMLTLPGQPSVPLVPRLLKIREAKAIMALTNNAIQRMKRPIDAEHDQAIALEARARARVLARRHREELDSMALGKSPKAKRRARASELDCRACGAPIALERIIRSELVAVCAFCGAVRDVRGFLKVDKPTTENHGDFLPDGISLEQRDGKLTLECLAAATEAHRVGIQYFLVVLCFVMFVGGGGVVAAGFLIWSYPTNLIVGFIGMGLVFLGLAGPGIWFRAHPYRKTIMTRLWLKHERTADQRHLSYTLHVGRIKEFQALQYDSGEGIAFSVVAITRDRYRHILASGLKSPRYALVISDAFTAKLNETRAK